MLAAASFAFLSSFFAAVDALTLPIERRSPAHSTTVVISNPANASVNGFSNAQQSLYSATIYIQGKAFQVQIDTGSADLWVDATGVDFTGLTNTGYNSSVKYGDTTSAAGPVVLANVTLGEFTVEGQAFMQAIGTNATTPGLDMGLLGVGPPAASQIEQKLTNSSYDGLPFLLNVFDYYPEDESFITFLLSRSPVGITEGGVFTISELVSDYVSVTDTPKLPIVQEEYFATYMDGIYVNGEYVTGHSYGVEGMPVLTPPGENQTTAVLDTGTTLITTNPYYVDAIFKDVPGAEFIEEISTYTVPCGTKLNVSLRFGEDVYPLDPLDVVNVNVLSNGSLICTGAFTYATGGFDFILGDSFLRNVYSLFNFGNWTTHGTAAPYMQILSVTDADEAWANFDALNVQRIGLLEWQNIQQNENITVSYSEAAPTSYSYSLMRPSATPTSASASSYRSSSSAASSSAAHPSSSSASSPSSASSSVHSSSAASSVAHSSSSATTPSSTTAAPSASANAADVDTFDSALAADTSSGDATATAPDYSGLLRNSYIIMGLLGGALVLLLAVLVKLIVSGRSAGYSRVPNVLQPPAPFLDKQYGDSDYSTPYDDPARQH